MNKKLTDYEQRKILTQWLDENDIEFDDKQFNRTLKNFNDIMFDPENAEMSKMRQESALTAVAFHVKEGMSNEKIFMLNTSYKHLNYFDFFLSEGESQKIIAALKQYDIPIDILRGVKKTLPMDKDNITFEKINKKGQKVKDIVRLTQTIVKEPNISPYIGEFIIEYKGKIIYEFNKDFSKGETYVDFMQRSYEKKDTVKRGKTIEKREVKTNKYTYMQYSYEKKDGTIDTKLQYAKGTVINGKKVGGQWLKKNR